MGMPSGPVRLSIALRRAENLVFLPALALPLYWLAGEAALLTLAVGLPIALLVGRRFWPEPAALPVSDQVIDRLDAVLHDVAQGAWQTGCFVVQFDGLSGLCDRLGRTRQSEILAASIARIRGAMRPGDILFPLEDGGLVIVLAPTQRLDLEVMVRIAGRLQMVVQQPMVLASVRGDDAAQVTCSIGFCHAGQLPVVTGQSLLEAAQVAIDEALRHGPGAIRGYSGDLATARAQRDALRGDFALAVDRGEVRAYFQPQLSTDSGEVSGFEVLARWHHPDQGCLAPGQFLPAIEGTDLMDRLGREMLNQALEALSAWDRAGLLVPRVAVNFSARELRDPQLPDQLIWALDRHGLAAGRLTVEVLESVIAGDGDDIITRNLSRLAALGCNIDLDDFGTGNASITSIRRFTLHRLKIDRSFVRGIDTDRGQQRLVTAILSLAEQLGLDTLGEGVETPGEHAMLAQLGCQHVQGYTIARPMPRDEVAPWLARHRESVTRALCIDLRTR
jgi:diguanylate cyclase